jgi:hypothetical protein
MSIYGVLCPGVMARSQIAGSHGEGFIEEEIELYVTVTGNTGVRSPPLPIFPAEIVDHARLEFLLQVNMMVRNAQNTADILCLMRLFVKEGRIPKAHMYAHYIIGGFFEQQGSYGRVHPTAQCYSDFPLWHSCVDDVTPFLLASSPQFSHIKGEGIRFTRKRAVTGLPCPR